MKIFVDESGWIRLLDPTAAYHKQFVEEFERAIDKGGRLVTHNIAVGTALSEVKNRMGMACQRPPHVGVQRDQFLPPRIGLFPEGKPRPRHAGIG